LEGAQCFRRRFARKAGRYPVHLIFQGYINNRIMSETWIHFSLRVSGCANALKHLSMADSVKRGETSASAIIAAAQQILSGSTRDSRRIYFDRRSANAFTD